MSLNASIWGPSLPAERRAERVATAYGVLSRVYQYTLDFTAACRDWDLALCQLSAGPFRGKLMQLCLPDLHLGRFRADRSLEHLGRGPHGMRTLVIPADSAQRFSWFGHRVGDGQVLLLPTDTTVFAVTPPGHDAFVVSVSEDLLAERLVSREYLALNRQIVRRDACIFSVPGIKRIRARLHRLHGRLVRDDDRAPSGLSGADLLDELLPPLAAAELVLPRSLRRRDQALIAARKLILEHDAEDLTVQELCDAGGVSERTLQYAFLEHYGVNPKRYLVVYRLNCVRDDLCRFGSDELKIADVANRWGFWHMGGFAADYRTLFGELPSETLHRARRQRDGRCLPAANADFIQDLAGWVATPLRSWGLQ